MSSEAAVVWSLKQQLQQQGLGAARLEVSEIAVDSDGSYRNSPYAADLEPMMSMPIHGFYPDLVCVYQQACQDGLAAFEVKGQFDEWLKGITQARAYRDGVHMSYLALPESHGSRFGALERDAATSGVGIWLLGNSGWREIIPAAAPRPNTATTRILQRALKGISIPGKLQLNHPLNYLAVAWIRQHQAECRVMDAMEIDWCDLRTAGSRTLAIRGAQYLGLLDRREELTILGRNAVDLMRAAGFSLDLQRDKRSRFCDADPGVAAVARMVLMQQESTKLIVEALLARWNHPINTEELLRKAEEINGPLASGIFLSNPRSAELANIPSSDFSPSTVFGVKQVLWHAGILSTPKHVSAGKSAREYLHHLDFWKLDERLIGVSVRSPAL